MGKKILSAIMMLLVFIPIFYVGGSLYNIFIYVLGFIAINEFINVKNFKKVVPLFIRILSYLVYSFFLFLSEIKPFTISTSAGECSNLLHCAAVIRVINPIDSP